VKIDGPFRFSLGLFPQPDQPRHKPTHRKDRSYTRRVGRGFNPDRIRAQIFIPKLQVPKPADFRNADFSGVIYGQCTGSAIWH
jgi:hypothetical protein